MKRCHWATTPVNTAYHDNEWGRPVHDDVVFFEFLTLEGAQAGRLGRSAKRDRYREVFQIRSRVTKIRGALRS